jgi:adenylylsulfate kinase
MTSTPGFALWLTGLPASGKTTLAEGLAEALRARGRTVQVLDSDALRSVITPDPSYSEEERDWFYRVVAFIAGLLVRNGVDVLIAATANRRRHRAYARQEIARFGEVFVKCSLEVCMGRDAKGIYEKALSGEATTVPGLQAPYEPPHDPLVVVNTERTTPREGTRKILSRLEETSYLQR